MEIRPSTSTSQPQVPSAMRDQVAVTASNRTVVSQTTAVKVNNLQASPSGQPAKEELDNALASINKTLQERAPGLEFSVDSESNRAIVKVVDMETKEVIRQMPSREVMEIAKALDKLQSLMARQTA